MKDLLITKANGKKALFDTSKVESTCIKAGAGEEVARKIATEVRSKSYPGITTREIYRLVLKLLSQKAGIAVKQRYRLKEAIMKMGPAGFHFENFIGKVLENYGYEILAIRDVIPGRCVPHEIDLILKSAQDGKKWLVECKYHNMAGRYTGLKDSLYTHARFLDLSDTFDKEMLACNTKVSDEVIKYANCIKQKILSWKYPYQNGLEILIESKKLYPVTILGLSRYELAIFQQQNMMIAKDLLDVDISQFAKATGLDIKRIIALQNRANDIIS